MIQGSEDIPGILHKIQWLMEQVEDIRDKLGGGEVNLFLFNTASTDIAGYKQLQTTHSAGAKQSVASTPTAADTLVEEWSTEATVPGKDFIPAGTVAFHFHGQRTAGTKDARYYFKLYKRTHPGAVETLIATSEESSIMTSTETAYNIHAEIIDTDITTTDRLVMKLYISPYGAGSNPTCSVFFEGVTNTRIDVPINLF